MANNNDFLHQEDEIFIRNFEFSDSIFDLPEPDIPTLGLAFNTPSDTINFKLKNCDNLLQIAHINARSLPKHIHEVERISSKTKFSALGISEHFLSVDTPKSVYQLPGYYFFYEMQR